MDANALQGINTVIKFINGWCDFVFLWGILFLILQYPVRYFTKSMEKYDKEKKTNPNISRGWDILTQTFILFLASLFAGFVWVVPELAGKFYAETPLVKALLPWATGYRWGWLFGAMFFFTYVFGHEHGEMRWFKSSLGHVAIISLGFILDGWMGILGISIPALAAYYITLYRLAMVTMPTSNSDDREEQRKRFLVFFAYSWGLQFPLIVVAEHAWKAPETRINGDFTWDYPLPGMIKTQSHQVVGITNGTNFRGVEGPGLIFTGKLERPLQIVDLRRQVRTTDVDVITRDGINLTVVLLSVFRIDNETWSVDLYKKLRNENPLLRGAHIPRNVSGIFKYSPQRVQAALKVKSIVRASRADEVDTPFHWDEWAVSIIEDHVRRVIASKSLDEFWRLPDDKDGEGKSALKEISSEIKKLSEMKLRANGILLYAANVVNFKFSDKDQEAIINQQIQTWSAKWEGIRSNILTEAETEAKRKEQKARAYAAELMVKAVGESLQNTQKLNTKLPPHLTAMLINALQEYIDKSPDEPTSKDEQHYIKETQQFNPHLDSKS